MCSRIESKFTDELTIGGVSCSFETVLSEKTSQLNVFFSEINDVIDQSLLQNRSATLMAFVKPVQDTSEDTLQDISEYTLPEKITPGIETKSLGNAEIEKESCEVVFHAISRICRYYEGIISVSCVDVYSTRISDHFNPKNDDSIKGEDALRRARTLDFVNYPESPNRMETNALPLILKSLNDEKSAVSTTCRPNQHHRIFTLQLCNLANRPRLVLIDLNELDLTSKVDVRDMENMLETLTLVLKSMSAPHTIKGIPIKESKISQLLQKFLQPECSLCLIIDSLSQSRDSKPQRVEKTVIETPTEQKKRIVSEWIDDIDQELEGLTRHRFEYQGLDLNKVPFIESVHTGQIPLDFKLCELLGVDDEYTEEIALLNSKIRDLESRKIQLSEYHKRATKMKRREQLI